MITNTTGTHCFYAPPVLDMKKCPAMGGVMTTQENPQAKKNESLFDTAEILKVYLQLYYSYDTYIMWLLTHVSEIRFFQNVKKNKKDWKWLKFKYDTLLLVLS